MMVELKEIIITKAEKLPIETQRKYGVYGGFVEVRLERNSPVEAKIIPLKGESPASRMRKAIINAGFEQKNFE